MAARFLTAPCRRMRHPCRHRRPIIQVRRRLQTLQARRKPRARRLRRNKMKPSRSFLLVLVAASLVLGGCSVFDEVGSWFASSGKKSNLRGVRIPVMSADSELKVDDTQTAPVVLPPPYRNPDWPLPGGYASNAMYHLDAPGRLRKIW